MTVSDSSACGDYPAPCNCDDPDTHDGAIEASIIDPARIKIAMDRLDSIIDSYKLTAMHLNVVADEDSIPTPSTMAEFVELVGLANVAFTLRRILTNGEGKWLMTEIRNSYNTAGTVEGFRLILEIEQFLNE